MTYTEMSEIFSAGNTADTASTDRQYFRVQCCAYREYSQYVICSILPMQQVYSQYFGFCTLTPPELRLFRRAMLQVAPVLAVTWKATASIGNILGSCAADKLLPLQRFARQYSHTASTRSSTVYTLNTPSIFRVLLILLFSH